MQSHLTQERRYASPSFRGQQGPDRRRQIAHRGIQANAPGQIALQTRFSVIRPASSIYERHRGWDIEEAFRNLKGDLAIRPVFHKCEKRIEAHIFVAFLAYCLQITLTRRLHSLAPGLTARSALAKFAALQMIDVHLPTTDGREIVLTRFTEPEPDLRLLIARMKLKLPAQPPPKIAAAALPAQHLL